MLTGTSDAIVVRIYGDDLDVLREKADEVKEVMPASTGSSRSMSTLQTDVPQIEVEVDLVKASELRHQAGRRAPDGGGVHRQRGGRRHLAQRQELRGPRLEQARGPQQPRAASATC